MDGLFYRGSFHLGTSAAAVRTRHLRAHPHMSAAHTRGEDLTTIVHGVATPVDVAAPRRGGLPRVPARGLSRVDVVVHGRTAAPGRIDAARMFAARVARLRDQPTAG